MLRRSPGPEGKQAELISSPWFCLGRCLEVWMPISNRDNHDHAMSIPRDGENGENGENSENGENDGQNPCFDPSITMTWRK